MDGLDKLKKRLWYLAVQEGTYRIDSQPNLNQMLVTRIDAVRQEPESVRERVRAALEDMMGRNLFGKPIPWPEGPRAVDDKQSLQLVIGNPHYAWGATEAEQKKGRAFIQDVLANAKSTFRQYKNTWPFSPHPGRRAPHGAGCRAPHRPGRHPPPIPQRRPL